MFRTKPGTIGRITRLGPVLTLALAGALSQAGLAQADPANENTFTFDVVCEGQLVTITGMLVQPPSINGAAGHVVGTNVIGVLMGLSVGNLLTGEETVILSRPIAERQELTTCTYTWPLAPPFLLFTAHVLFTPRA
jgi:hypothetical protein